ncbi:MAG: glycine--tRNA ligase subunit beta [Desulfuromonadales bacterium]|nr:glycine--tRNA ligase subunit beta [Desulfuromonadales bacterium]
MSAELFLEIGAEEIPAGFIPVALADLERLLRKEFDSAQIGYGAIRTFGTPRRLAIAIDAVVIEQPTRRSEAMGPARHIAFDADGQPTKAAIGFARGQGVDVADLKIVTTDKGEYICAEKEEVGRKTVELLPELLPKMIAALPFRKSMRWKDLEVRFARPLHWIVALFDGEVVPFTYGNLTSGNHSRGHRFLAPQEFCVSSANDYLSAAEKHFVIADIARRKARIKEQVAAIAAAEGAHLLENEELLDEVTNLVEFPVALAGGFDPEFLKLPRELLITSMREHQRYFSLIAADGKLLPRFITIANNQVDDPAVIVRGNERVIRPRLSDAMFFWEKDQQTPLANRLDALKNVVYQRQLGTSFEKVLRFKTIAAELAERFEPAAKALTERASELAKCDLESNMVYEFPELQGVMGREYALLEGEDPRVARAIFEHYLPVEAGGELPSDNVGAFVSLADKIDTLCGCFGVGLIPTGSADPYALRRTAIGILSIILDRGYSLSIPELVARAVAQLAAKLTRPATEVQADVIEFIRLRLVNLLTGQGYAQDVVDAVLCAAFDDVTDAVKRVKALAQMKTRDDFEALAVAFKRVVNIIKDGVVTEVNPKLFEKPSEQKLLTALEAVENRCATATRSADYTAALRTIATLREPVDDFFAAVMVMAEDEKVKANRLALLTRVAGLFAKIADFTRLSI